MFLFNNIYKNIQKYRIFTKLYYEIEKKIIFIHL